MCTPDIGFVSGSTEAFKTVNLYDVLTAVRGTENTDTGATVSVQLVVLSQEVLNMLQVLVINLHTHH